MLSIIARIADKVVVEVTSTVITPEFMDAIAINYGGTAADYTYYTVTAEEEARVTDGDQYTLTWSDSTIVGLDFSVEDAKKWLEVTLSINVNKVTFNTVDISKVKIYQEGTKYYQNDLVFIEDTILKCQVAEDIVKPTAGENWSLEAPASLATFRILMANKVDVDDTATFTDVLEIRLPNKRAEMGLVFDKGTCSIPVILNSFENCGTWTIPSSDRVMLNGSEHKVVGLITFKGLLPY